MTLYRKYRPQKLSEVVGQSQITDVLSKAISSQKLAHAYLFAGPRGTGKTSIARIMAKAINCLNREDGVELPCNECANCLAINQGAFMDVVEIDAASKRSVEEARELIDQIHAVPTIGTHKIYILDEVHMLTKDAFNTLLKSLEEPPAHVVFILCTTEFTKVPATITSRCQRFLFNLASLEHLQQRLGYIAEQEQVNIDPDALLLLAQLADGGYRDGVMLLDQTITTFKQQQPADSSTITRQQLEQQLGLASQQMTQQIIEQLLQSQSDKAINLIEQFSAEGGEVRYLANDLVNQLRTLLFFILKADTVKQQTSQQDQAWLEKQSVKTNVQALVGLIKSITASQQQRTSVVHPALSLELAVLEAMQLPSVAAAPPSVKTATILVANQPAPIIKTAPAKSSSAPAEIPAEEPVAPLPDPTPTPLPAEPPADLMVAWEQVLVGVVGQNRSIGALLRHHCTPISHNGTILLLQFWNSFHKKQVETEKNRIVVEEIATTVFGQPIKVRAELADKSLRPKKQPMAEEDVLNIAPVEPDSDLVDTALEMFGGELVD